MHEGHAVAELTPEVYQRLRRRMELVLDGYRIPRQDQEDLVQTTWLLAASQWGTIRQPEAWVLGTLRNRCLIYQRDRRQHACRFVPLDGIGEAAAAIAPVQSKGELLADLGAAWRQLPRTQRRLVLLRFHLGLTSREAARAAGLARDSVRKILNRAQARLRELLGEPPRVGASSRPARRRRRPPAPPAWRAAVDTWLDDSGLMPATCHGYRVRLAAAAVALRHMSLAELAPVDLADCRTALLEKGWAHSTHRGVLAVLCAFLVWARERDWHAIDAGSIRMALYGWRGAGGRPRRVHPAAGEQAAAAAEQPLAARGRPGHSGGA